MDNNVGENPVDLQEKKEAYREEAEEEAEEDHLSPSYASILTQSMNEKCLHVMQTMVVRDNPVSSDSRYLWTNRIRLQSLRLDRALEAHPRPNLDRVRGSICLGSYLVRSQKSLKGKRELLIAPGYWQSMPSHSSSPSSPTCSYWRTISAVFLSRSRSRLPSWAGTLLA